MSWSDVRLVTIDHTKCGSSDDTNYPVCFTGTYAALAATGSGGVVTSGSGYDMGFYSDSAGTTKRNWELVTWNSATGFVEMYWLEPTVTFATDTADTYRCAGNATITTDQSAATATWNSNFVMVTHLPNGTTLTAADSTSNANNGTLQGAPSAITGQVDGGAAFVSASSQYVSMASASSLNMGTNDWTGSFWIKTNNVASNPMALTKMAFVGSSNPDAWWVEILASGNVSGGIFKSSGSQLSTADDGAAVNDNAWHLVVVVWNRAGNLLRYVDGVVTGTAKDISSMSANNISGTLRVCLAARDASAGSELFLDGSMDEARLSKSARSADWITKDYNNQNSPSTFYTLGSNLGGAVALIQPSRVGRLAVRRASFY